MKNKKFSLIACGAGFVLCSAALVGTTLAWYTDTAENTGNVIASGKLDVDFLKWNGSSYQSIDDEGSVFGSNVQWEPGMTQVAYLKVENKGTLSFDYNIIVSVSGDKELADTLTYSLIDPFDASKTTLPTSWSDFESNQTESGALPYGETVAAPHGNLKASESDCFAVAVHMDENAGNEAMDKTVNIDFAVRAKQTADETDGFGNNDYDSDVDFGYETVNYDPSLSAKQNGEKLQKILTGAKENETVYVSAGTFDLPTGTETYEDQSGWYLPILADGVRIVGSEGTVLTSSTYTENTKWSSQNLITIFGDDVTIENVTVLPKDETNKSIEVVGKNVTLRNVTIMPKEENSDPDFGGSLYFNGDIGNATLENVTLKKSFISTVLVASGTISAKNVTVDFAGCSLENDNDFAALSANAPQVFTQVENMTVKVTPGKESTMDGRLPEGATLLPVVEYEDSETARENGERLQKILTGAKENETVYVSAGTFDLPTGTETYEDQSGWYLPIVADGVKIVGTEGTVLTSSTYTENANWSSQNLITVFGDNVTIENVTVLPKDETNKSIEVVGKNVTLRNVTIMPKEENSDPDFGGSLYFNGDIGNATLENVTLEKSFISTSLITNNGTISAKNVTVDFAGCSKEGAAGFAALSANAPQIFTQVENMTVKVSAGKESTMSGRLPAGATLVTK